MQVKTVSYSRLHTTGRFENEQIRMEAILEDGEDPAVVTSKLRRLVEDQIAEGARERGDSNAD